MSKRTGVKKVLTHVAIREDLLNRVIEVATRRFNIVRGALSLAIEEALELWLAHTEAHMPPNPRASARERYNAVVREIELEFNYVPIQVPSHTLLSATMRALHIKERSAWGWVFRFFTSGFIKPLSPPGFRPRNERECKKVRTWELVAKEA